MNANPDHSTYMNCMDDDTVEVGCHYYCNWHETGYEDDAAAQDAIDQHEADQHEAETETHDG